MGYTALGSLCSLLSVLFTLCPTLEACSQASTFIFWPTVGRQMLVNCCIADTCSCVRGQGCSAFCAKLRRYTNMHAYILFSYLLFHQIIWHSFPVWKSIWDFDACYCWKTESLNENNKECFKRLSFICRINMIRPCTFPCHGITTKYCTLTRIF